MEEVNLDRLVRDIIETYPNGQPIKPQILIQGTLPSVMGNAALLTQCVANLLANGAKFVSTGTAPVMQIWAEARQLPVVREWDGAKLESSPTLPGPAQRNKPPVVRLWFKDNGIGIAAEDHQRVVRLFERIHPATEYEGTGLGLTIVKKAVERMGAQFGFDSELGRGSQFWIDLTNVAKL
jgi:signal transduction histidine kinase